MLDVDRLCRDFEACLGWPYVTPGTNDERGIDCSGMFVRAYRLQGAKIYHGSNTIWRSYMDDTCKGRLTSAGQLQRGMAVFKWLESGDRQKDGLGNFCHIGLVTSTNPLRIVHASTDGMRVKVDSSVGKWKYFGRLRAVDYGGAVSTSPVVQTSIQPRATIKRGARGDDVKVLQLALASAGYAIEVDGIFGLATRAAVVQYQTVHGLVPDGIVGRLTWAALGVT